jgi:hypothetical protein
LPAVKALALASVPFAGVADSTPTPSGWVDDPFTAAPDNFAVAGTSEAFAEPVGSNALPVLTIGLASPFTLDANVVVAAVSGVETVVPPAVTVTVPLPSGVFDAVVPTPVPPLPFVPLPAPPPLFADVPADDPDDPVEPDPPPPEGVAAEPTPPLPAPTLSPPPLLPQAERRSAQLATPIANAEGSFRIYFSTAQNPFGERTGKMIFRS